MCNSGDVKFHLGWCGEIETNGDNGGGVNVAILPDPSNLDPVAQGMVRAIQKMQLQQEHDGSRKTIMALNTHTDAAFSGQGIDYETLGLWASQPILPLLTPPATSPTSQRVSLRQYSTSMATTWRVWFFISFASKRRANTVLQFKVNARDGGQKEIV
ncbi:hypothetical protein BJY04DRAFT_216211 [Aspergillus karnatakaensis]|uniref:uncharacterized protein n=1 Tax=Aspergillus karnatakaensis TaxID=1810916 RepID=UPI003CCDEECF